MNLRLGMVSGGTHMLIGDAVSLVFCLFFCLLFFSSCISFASSPSNLPGNDTDIPFMRKKDMKYTIFS